VPRIGHHLNMMTDNEAAGDRGRRHYASRAGERERTRERILGELLQIHCGELRIEVYPSGVVVSDGDALWTASAGALLRGAQAVKAELVRIRRGTDDPAEHGFRAYDRLCSVVPSLARADEPRHRRTVKAWRREHGAPGNWS
jgi:hypothetical protein